MGLDAALERCEDAAIEAALAGGTDEREQLFERTADALMRDLDRLERFEELARDLEGWTEPRSCAPGQALDGGTGTHEDLHLVLSGRVSSYDAHRCCSDPALCSEATASTRERYTRSPMSSAPRFASAVRRNACSKPQSPSSPSGSTGLQWSEHGRERASSAGYRGGPWLCGHD